MSTSAATHRFSPQSPGIQSRQIQNSPIFSECLKLLPATRPFPERIPLAYLNLRRDVKNSERQMPLAVKSRTVNLNYLRRRM